MLGLLAAKPLVEHAAFLLVVMIAYLLLMLLLGYVAGLKTTDNSDDYMAAEGKMPFWLVTATILATFICGATIMGGGGVAYSDGFPATIADPFAACLCLIAGGFIFQGQIRRTGAVSPAAVYQNRYGVLGGVIAGVCTIMPMLFFAGAQVAATGKLFQIVLGWPFRTTAILSGIFVIVYTAFGGITAVVWTDFAQVLILTENWEHANEKMFEDTEGNLNQGIIKSMKRMIPNWETIIRLMPFQVPQLHQRQ